MTVIYYNQHHRRRVISVTYIQHELMSSSAQRPAVNRTIALCMHVAKEKSINAALVVAVVVVVGSVQTFKTDDWRYICCMPLHSTYNYTVTLSHPQSLCTTYNVVRIICERRVSYIHLQHMNETQNVSHLAKPQSCTRNLNVSGFGLLGVARSNATCHLRFASFGTSQHYCVDGKIPNGRNCIL